MYLKLHISIKFNIKYGISYYDCNGNIKGIGSSNTKWWYWERKGEREKEENKLLLHLETKEISWNSEGIIIEVGKTGFFSFTEPKWRKCFHEKTGIFKQLSVH